MTRVGGLWGPWEEMFLCPQVCALQWGEGPHGADGKAVFMEGNLVVLLHGDCVGGMGAAVKVGGAEHSALLLRLPPS